MQDFKIFGFKWVPLRSNSMRRNQLRVNNIRTESVSLNGVCKSKKVKYARNVHKSLLQDPVLRLHDGELTFHGSRGGQNSRLMHVPLFLKIESFNG